MGWNGLLRKMRIWVWNRKNDRLYQLTTVEGLPNNAVSSLLEDDEGIVWASTLNGICKITLQTDEKGDYTFSIVNFSVSDGLQSGIFYTHAALKARNGMLYFGGAHGFNYFDPKNMMYDDYASRPILTGLTIFNTPDNVNTEYNGRLILKETLNRTREIVLRHNENFITLEFSGLNYANPSHTYYKLPSSEFLTRAGWRVMRQVWGGLSIRGCVPENTNLKCMPPMEIRYGVKNRHG